jgi:PAS domain S-box-containing protein
MPLILILDDHATNRSIYARLAMLTADDVTVESFADPVDALDWLSVNPVDLVITDYKMPGMNGAEFTRRLRASASDPEVPVVVVTAHDDRSFRQHAMEAGATDFLRSPVDHFEFVARARNLLALPRRAATPAVPEVTLAEDLPGLVTATDRVGRLIFVNARQARCAGATPAELVGQDVARVLGAERAERSRAKDREVLETGRQLPSYWEEAPHPGGRRMLLTAKAPLHGADGRVIGVLSTSLEIDPGALPPPRDGREGRA